MEPKGSKAIVGLFVLLLGVGVVATILWLVGTGGGLSKTYLVYTGESVAGLVQDAPVKYMGVDVGRVAAIAFRPNDPETVQLTLEIDPKAPVREDTRAQMEFQGLTGLAFINLIEGSRESPPLRAKPGEPHPVIESTPSLLARLDTGVSGLIVSLRETSDEMQGVLGAVDREKLARTIASLERVSGALAAHSDALERGADDASRLLANTADASERLPALMTRMETLAEEWSAAGKDVTTLATTGREEISRASNEVAGETQALAEDLRRLVGRLDRVAAELEADPSVVLHGRGDAQPGPGE